MTIDTSAAAIENIRRLVSENSGCGVVYEAGHVSTLLAALAEREEWAASWHQALEVVATVTEADASGSPQSIATSVRNRFDHLRQQLSAREAELAARDDKIHRQRVELHTLGGWQGADGMNLQHGGMCAIHEDETNDCTCGAWRFAEQLAVDNDQLIARLRSEIALRDRAIQWCIENSVCLSTCSDIPGTVWWDPSGNNEYRMLRRSDLPAEFEAIIRGVK